MTDADFATRDLDYTAGAGETAADYPTLSAKFEQATEVVRTALRLPAGALVDGDRRKAALRAAARPLVPASVAERDKKAVQYGSYVSRELDRLARRAGFKRRTENHVGRYVRSVVE